jgi:hypothetical protein
MISSRNFSNLAEQAGVNQYDSDLSEEIRSDRDEPREAVSSSSPKCLGLPDCEDGTSVVVDIIDAPPIITGIYSRMQVGGLSVNPAVSDPIST